jgi:hypothetical protein
MGAPVRIPGGREVRGTLDDVEDADALVVACPPHPQLGGSRTDPRLTAVSDALGSVGIACLRFDYGPWDEGHGERADAVTAIEWARDRFDRVGVFGYSFGGAVALLAAAETPVEACSVLAPVSSLGPALDAAQAVQRIACPLQVTYGTRDDTADAERIVDALAETDAVVTSFPATHAFAGHQQAIGDAVASFFETAFS